VWATGAATAEVLRSGGYPASRYVGTGEVADGVWSLQEVLPGEVPLRLDGPLAVQLVELAGCHATDAGARRDWKADAREAAEGWIDTLSDDGVAPGFLDVMASTLEATTAAELLETTVVHGDFHHGNCTTIGGGVAGVFDWEIAGPGDWRFDLCSLRSPTPRGPRS
jgi:aminoglycoside phosphotransferase (APT) family kinase protein